MALLTAQQTAPSPKAANWNFSRLIARGNKTPRGRTSRGAKHSCHYQAGRESHKGCRGLKSSLYHRGWVCGASLLLLAVTIRGLSKVHTMRDAVAAVWALMGAFLLAGGWHDKLTELVLYPNRQGPFSLQTWSRLCITSLLTIMETAALLWLEMSSCKSKIIICNQVSSH